MIKWISSISGICNSDTGVLDRVWIRRMQKAVSICVRKRSHQIGGQASSNPSTHIWEVGWFFFTRVYKADRMQISSGLITRHAYYMSSRIARNANRKPIYLTDDK